MKRLLLCLLLVLAVLVGAMLILPGLVPSSVYRERIETMASSALDREVTLSGEVALSVFPTLSARVEGIRVANPEGFSHPNMIEAGALRARIRLLPLLFRTVEIGEISLLSPTIRLEKRADGQANWMLGSAGPEADEAEDEAVSPSGGGSGEARLDRARLVDANVFYTDHTEGRTIALTGFSAEARMRSLRAPLTSRGRGEMNEEGFSYDIRLGSVDDLIAGRTTPLSLEVDTDHAALSYDGTLINGQIPGLRGAFQIEARNGQDLLPPDHPLVGPLQLIGQLDLSGEIDGALIAPVFRELRLRQSSDWLTTRYDGGISLAYDRPLQGTLSLAGPDLRGLLGQLDLDLPEGERLGAFELTGTLGGTLSRPRLNQTRLALDALRGSGLLGADLDGPRPKLVATLDFPTLDLTPFFGAEAAASEAPPSLDKDWSDDPLALDGLKLVDADLDLTADRVILDEIHLEQARVQVGLDRGRLTIRFRPDDTLPGFRAFEGAWSGDIDLDASRTVPHMQLRAEASGIAARQLLRDLTGFGGVSGLGDVSLDLRARGNSLKALVSALDGTVNTRLDDGLFGGVDMTQMVRAAGTLQADIRNGTFGMSSFGSAFGRGAETDFTQLVGKLSLTQGVAEIDELSFHNATLSVSGTGQIDLGRRRLDIQLTPRVTIDQAGTTATLGVGQLEVPLRIQGPWTAPGFAPDARVVENALRSRLQDRLTNELTRRLAPNLSPTPEADTPSEESEDTARPSLEQQIIGRALRDLGRRGD